MTDSAHSRKISAPCSFISSSGLMVLPRLFDIFMPRASIVKPCVSTAANGARPRVPQLSRSDDWNQPRCWSRALEIQVGRPVLVRPAPALQHECMGRPAVEPHVENVAHHLVIVRVTIAQEPRRIGFVPGIHALLADRLDDAPVDLEIHRARRSSCATNKAIGTPHARCRLITQSGRPSTIDPIRLRPFSGTNRVSAIAPSPSRAGESPSPLREGRPAAAEG